MREEGGFTVPPPGHSEAEKKVLGCKPHRVRVARYQWPPRQKRANEERATLAVACVKCGAIVLAEADPVPRNLEVVLYGPVADPAGVVVEEGSVVEAEAVEAAERVAMGRGGTVREEGDQQPPRSGGGRIRG